MNKKTNSAILFFTFWITVFTAFSFAFAEERLTIFIGAASSPPAEEIVQLFENETGIKVDTVYGGSGYILSQMMLAKRGDVYFPGSSDYMEKAKKEGYVFPESERIVVYLVPSINVQKGNPKKIKELRDLIRDDIKVAIANPEGVCVGAYAAELIEKWFTEDEKQRLKNNIVHYPASCASAATAVSLKLVDAIIGWSVFQYWDEERIETIPLDSKEIIRVGYIPVAISKFTRNKGLSQKFIDFLVSEKAMAIFKKHNYFTSQEEVFSFIGEKKPVGGSFAVPADWLNK